MADKPSISIRFGNVYDLFAAEYLLVKGLEESNGLLPQFDQLPTLHKMLNMLASKSVFFACQVEEKRERIVGCLALNPQEFSWSSSTRVLSSVHFYVLPEARTYSLPNGASIADGLIEAGRALADATGYPLHIEQIHQLGPDNRAAAKDELFKRSGLSYVGGNFIYLPPAQEAEEKAA